jgi:glycyl-tRNA synthetase
MEIEYFVKPGEDEAAHQMWIDTRTKWYADLGLRPENLRQREQTKDELAHYSKRCVDLEYKFPMGFSELEGIANRGDFDLSAHSRGPKNPDAVAELRYFDQEQKKHIIPYVIEPSAGADRATLAFLCDAYDVETVGSLKDDERTKLGDALKAFVANVEKNEKDVAVKESLLGMAKQVEAGDIGQLGDLVEAVSASEKPTHKALKLVGQGLADNYTRTVLHLHPRLAPIKAAVFPLKKNEPRLVELARQIKKDLQAAGVRAVYDDTGAIGKLYRRQDEIGTPFCITVDFQSLEDGTVTLRDRDTMGQERAKHGDLASAIGQKL